MVVKSHYLIAAMFLRSNVRRLNARTIISSDLRKRNNCQFLTTYSL